VDGPALGAGIDASSIRGAGLGVPDVVEHTAGR
jgi:hypothetical protein